MTPESAVRNEIGSWMKLKRILGFVHDSVGIFDPVRKIYRTNKNPYRRKGVGDLLGVLPAPSIVKANYITKYGWTKCYQCSAELLVQPAGRFLSVEVKTPEMKDLFGKKIQSKGYASPEQKVFIEDVNNQGGVALIAWSVRDVEQGLAERGIAL